MLNSELHSCIELHDTTVEGIAEVGTQIVLFLRAYIHVSDGDPGRDPGKGFVQAAALTFSDAVLTGEIPELPADIGDGDLNVGSAVTDNAIPIPFSHEGKIVLKLSLVGPAEIAITGSRASLTLIGDPVSVEEFPGSDPIAQ